MISSADVYFHIANVKTPQFNGKLKQVADLLFHLFILFSYFFCVENAS